MPAFNPERASLILSDALLAGDLAAAQKWGIDIRTIRNYRSRLDTDPHFAAFFQSFRRRVEDHLDAKRDWFAKVPEALEAAADFLRRAAQEADPTNPFAIKAVSEAFAVLADVEVTNRVLNERLRKAGEESEEARQMAGATVDTEAYSD